MRRDNWWSLAIEAADRHRVPFRWGESDCVIFTADVVEAMTGHDPASAVRGKYRSARGAAKMMKKHGYEDIQAVMERHFSEIAPSLAGRGSVAIIMTDLGDFASAICAGEVILAKSPDGVEALPRTRMIRAFDV